MAAVLTVSACLNDPPCPGFLSLSLSGCGINMDYTLSLPDWITDCMTSDDTDHRNQRATQTPELIPVSLYSYISLSVRLSGGRSIQILYFSEKEEYPNVKTKLCIQMFT